MNCWEVSLAGVSRLEPEPKAGGAGLDSLETLGGAGEDTRLGGRKPNQLREEEDAMGRQQNKVEEEGTTQT